MDSLAESLGHLRAVRQPQYGTDSTWNRFQIAAKVLDGRDLGPCSAHSRAPPWPGVCGRLPAASAHSDYLLAGSEPTTPFT
jgi:hypothetical protein